MSAARRPGNAADAPRSIPGGGSAPVLPHGRRGLGRARSRRLAHGQGGGRVSSEGPAARRLPPRPVPARPRRAPGSSAALVVARRCCHRPRGRRDLLLLKPKSDSGSPAAGGPAPRPARGPGRFPCRLGARRPPPPRPRLCVSGFSALPARRSFRFPGSC